MTADTIGKGNMVYCDLPRLRAGAAAVNHRADLSAIQAGHRA
jgi:hypothetical protein